MVYADVITLSNDQVSLALIALMGGGMASFFKLINSQNKTHDKLTHSLADNTKALNKIASATQQGNKEAEKRNGHLAELVVQQGENTKAIAETATSTIIGAVQNVKTQHIEFAHVEKEVVKQKK